MSSNLKVNTILPSVGSNIGIGTNGGELNVDGGCKVQVGTALTLGHSIGLQYATQNLHSEGFEINQINASGIITASHFYGNGANITGVLKNIVEDTSPQLGGDLASNSNDILMADNDQIKLGSSNDFTMYHDSSGHTFLQDQGNGALRIRSDNEVAIQKWDGSTNENMAKFIPDGAVELYHDNVKKMETTSVGVTMNDTLITNGEIRPANDNNHSIGRSNRRYITYFGVNGSINTSDRNEKNTIVDSDLGLDFINKLNPVSYKWNKDDGKTHYGLIVQDLEETLTSIGKTVSDFGGIYKEPNSPMGLGYSELISPLIKAVQELSVENAALKARLDAAGL